MPTNWTECEREAFRLYVEEGKTAEESVRQLNQRHDISMRQFKSKMGRLKNLHANEWREIGKEILKREAEGKTSEVYVYGQKQGPSRIKRALRHSTTTGQPSNTHMGFSLLAAFDNETRLPATSLSQSYVRVSLGQTGWIKSTLMTWGANISFSELVTTILENIIKFAPGEQQIQLEGYTDESLNQMFSVVMRFVSNRFLHGNHLFNFINWMLCSSLVGKLYMFLQLNPSGAGTFIHEVLHTICDEAETRYLEPRRNSRHVERTFFSEHPNEVLSLIQAADHRSIEGHLGGRLLTHIALSNNSNAAKLLIDRGADVDYVGSWSPVSWFERPNFQNSSAESMTPLSCAVHRRYIDMVHCLVHHGADINKRFKRWNGSIGRSSALHAAIDDMNVEMVEILLNLGARIFDDTLVELQRRRPSPLFVETQNLLIQSLRKGLNSSSSYKMMLLVHLAECGNDPLSQFLLENSIIRPEVLEAALCYAVSVGWIKAVMTLLDRGVDPNALRYRNSRHPEDLSQPVGSVDENSHSDSYSDSDSDLIPREIDPIALGHRTSSHSEDLSEHINFIEENSISTSDSGADTEDIIDVGHPLCLCVEDSLPPSSVEGIIYLLLTAGATTNYATIRYFGAKLHSLELEVLCNIYPMVVRSGHNFALLGPDLLSGCVENDGSVLQCGMMLDLGVDINARGVDGSNALYIAAGYGNLALVRFLVRRGANVNLSIESEATAYNPAKPTALHYAAWKGHYKVVDCLLESGADVQAPSGTGGCWTVLEAAASALVSALVRPNHLDEEGVAMFKKLLCRGAPINRPDGTDSTVLHSLIKAFKTQCLKEALEAGANPESRNSERRMTPLQTAASIHNLEAIKILLNYNSDINAPASDLRGGCTALQAAVSALSGATGLIPEVSNGIEMIKFLLQHHADINAPAGKNEGRTALQAATSQEKLHPAVIEILLQHGAVVDTLPARQHGLSALQGVAISGDIQIAKLLLAYGADVNAPKSLKNGHTAIEMAAKHGRLEMVRLFISVGATAEANGTSQEQLNLLKKGFMVRLQIC
ncbi:ankyrin repeat-containing domain protein [Mariannaea sp. PMI_226]|nr:ankyrin repeat-containing domain protein [Mariannaea sp. PMI_226]